MKHLAAAIALLSLLAAADPRASAAQELNPFQGEWTMESEVVNGIDVPEEMAQTMQCACKDDIMTVTMNGRMNSSPSPLASVR